MSNGVKQGGILSPRLFNTYITVDHLLRLKNTIKHIIQNRKDAYVTFLDVTKAYDKAWLDAILYVMHKEGTYLPTWKLVKYLNSNPKATLKTKHGNT